MVDISAILKNVPKERFLALYSPAFGWCKLVKAYCDGIDVESIEIPKKLWHFDSFGRLEDRGECLLFPCDDFRTWNGWQCKLLEIDDFIRDGLDVCYVITDKCGDQLIAKTVGGKEVYLDLDDVTWATEEDFTVSKEPEISNLPRTWKEFCDKYPVQANEHYIDRGQAVDYNAVFGDKYNHNRFEFQDSGLLPNKEICEAVLALCKLIQLMHCYNNSVHSKDYINNYCTLGFNCEGSLSWMLDAAPIFYFKNNILRSKFIENFRDLLETSELPLPEGRGFLARNY